MEGFSMITRRNFLKLSAASVGALLAARFKLMGAWAAIRGGTIDTASIPKYALPLVIPPAMPKQSNSKKFDFYKIAVRQFRQQILPPELGLPLTTVWSYGAKKFPQTFNYPAFTIEATHNRPVRVQWMNELVDPATGKYLPHLLPVDQTLHWANPPGGVAGRDMRPTFAATPGPYTGPVPIVPHLHGSEHVGDESDGYAEAWFLPPARNIPAGYATEGIWYDFFKDKALQKFGADWEPGTATFQYPNNQRATTLWYHDHTLGMTRLNVYAGPAGFYLIRGGPDDVVLDSRDGTTAILPGPAPTVGSNPFGTFYEIPIAVQDRSFNADGSLFYPDTRAFFDEFAGPFIPDSNVSPIWNPEFFGNTMVINGRTWPFLDVEQRRYRFRFLNGCDSRFLILDFNNIPGVEAWLIGTEGGFLPEPFNITALNDNRMLLGLAERADMIVDFTHVPQGSHILANLGPDEPFGGGIPGVDFTVSDPDTTGQVMEFRVGPAAGTDPSTPPQFLQFPAITPLPEEIRARQLALIELMSSVHDGPSEAVLGNVEGDSAVHKMWSDPISENPAAGDTEVWEFNNFTEDAHPMHVHEVQFQVVNRQAISFEVNEMGHIHSVGLVGEPRPPEAWETGLKDTVIAYPGEVTRLRIKFEGQGQFVWHCHIVEHEDNEMMRPYRIGPVQPGQPPE